MAAAAVAVEATAADHHLLAPVNPREVVLEVAFPELRPMLRRRHSVVLMLVEADSLQVLPGDMEEEGFRLELPEEDTGTTEAAIRRLSTTADRVVALREVSQMQERAALPALVPDQLEVEVVTLAEDRDQREDRLALDLERDLSVDRAVMAVDRADTAVVIPKK